jgi:competence ComEA-like helix-hairpin-helix protein
MALFSFGRKDKNPTEVAAPVAKTQPTPPKIQTPPGAGAFPAVKAPQPTGLLVAPAMPAGTATTQPMAIPRTGTTGLKPARPGVAQSTRSTQRIVLPTPPGSRPNSTKPLTMGTATGRINLPIGMILRCLPPEVLADDISKFEANGMAATEIGLPMQMILGQLPSGKVEMTLQELIPHFPPRYLQPTESIASYLPNLVSLPLMDVVMRIPPDLLALRPDQKDVDAAVINMADPFTEEILREQAETARRQSQTNIIDESQAPHEEFVPRDQAGLAKAIAPPRRPAAEPLIPSRALAPITQVAPPMPPVAKPPTPPPMSSLRGNPVMPSSIPVPIPQSPSASGQIPAPARSTTSLPGRPQGPAAIGTEAPPPSQPTAPIPPVPRHTGPIPAPPPPRHTTSLPVPRRTGSVPTISASSQAPVTATTPQVPASAEPPPTSVVAGAPDAGADDLARLAALAMAQLGDSAESTAEAPPLPEPVSVPEAKIEEAAPAPALASEPIPVSEPPPVASAEPAVIPAHITEPVSEFVPQPSSAVMPPPAEPEAPADAPPAASVAFNLNTCTAEDLVKNIPDCTPELAESIIQYRTKIGSFKRIEELLDVPGITKAAYTDLTGEAPPDNRISLSLNELLGFPAEQHVSLKDVTDRIACWPDVTGCVLSQSSGLSLVGTAPEGVDKAAVVAFAPRMFEAINKSFSEVSGQETDALLIPSSGISYHLFRNRDLYLIIMSRLAQMPERHVKVARFVLAALSVRRD